MRTEGSHIIMDASGCNPETLNNLEVLEQILKDAAEKANATVLNVAFHHFTPQGVSGVVVISESHFSIHTWPEYGYAALDFYTCGDADPELACKYVAEKIEAKSVQTTEIVRGEEKDGKYLHRFLTTKERKDEQKVPVLS